MLDLESDAVGHKGPGQPVPLTTGKPSDTVPCRPSRLNSTIVECAVPPGDIDIWLGLEYISKSGDATMTANDAK